MKRWQTIIAILLLAGTAQAEIPQTEPAVPRVSPIRPVATYSIVARDAKTGQMGVAVQSHWFNVGALVPWAEAGVGAVATQSMVDPSYGANGLALMANGVSAPDAVQQLISADKAPEIRQVAMVDSKGLVAGYTGRRCIAHAGHEIGQGYSVQANLMGPTTVPKAMAAAYEAARGPLAERLVAALAAAQHEGGDIRGRQSAAIIVVRAEATGEKWNDVLVDLRVEDNPNPVQELTRLLQMHRGYEMMNAGDLAVEADNLKGANYYYGEAERILAGNPEAQYWHAIALVNAGQLDAALPIFGQVFHTGENWRELTPRLVRAGFLTADDATLQRIMTIIRPRP